MKGAHILSKKKNIVGVTYIHSDSRGFCHFIFTFVFADVMLQTIYNPKFHLPTNVHLNRW